MNEVVLDEPLDQHPASNTNKFSKTAHASENLTDPEYHLKQALSRYKTKVRIVKKELGGVFL